MTNKEMLNNISNAEAGEMIANNCYDKLLLNSCCYNCSECYSNWLSGEVEKNEIRESN